MNKKTISTIIALAISGFFLWIAFKNIDFKTLFETFKSINWIYLIPFLIITWVSFWWRAVRWQCLLQPYRKIHSWSLFAPLMIGFGFNSIFPARAGEFARPYALYKKEKVPITTGISTVVLERITDIIALLTLFAISFLFIEFDSDVSRVYNSKREVLGEKVQFYADLILLGVIISSIIIGIWGAKFTLGRKIVSKEKAPTVFGSIGAAYLLASVGVWFWFRSGYEAGQLYSFGTNVEINAEKLQEIARGASVMAVVVIFGSVMMISHKVRDLFVATLNWKWFPLPGILKAKITDVFLGFAQGFDALRKPSLAGQVAFHTFVVWFLTGLSFWVMGLGVPDFELTLPLAMVFLVITCIVISIPAAPGFWGLYELGGVVALILCGVVADTPAGTGKAMGFTLIVHFFQWAMVTIIGLYYAGKIHISAKDVESAKEETSHAPDPEPAS